MKTSRLPAAVGGVMLSVLLSITPAAQALSVQSTASVSATNIQGVTQTNEATAQTAGGLASANALLLNPFSNASLGNAWSQGGVGYASAFLQGYATQSSYGAPGINSITAQAQSLVQDSFVITCPGCQNGTVGVLHAQISLGGSSQMGGGLNQYPYDSSFYGSMNWRLYGDIRSELPNLGPDSPSWYTPYVGYSREHHEYVMLSHDLGSESGDTGIRVFSIAFIFGEPITLSLEAVASMDATVSLEGSRDLAGWMAGSADLVRGVVWAGINHVLTADGQEISSFSALSANGTDYARSYLDAAISTAPEPASWMLLALGTLAVCGTAHRRRNTTSHQLEPSLPR